MSAQHEQNRISLQVLGMRNNACREAVVAALECVRGVADVQVSLYRGLAVVRHDGSCTDSELMTAVVQAGFRAAPRPY